MDTEVNPSSLKSGARTEGRWAYGFECLTRVSWAPVGSSVEIQFGSGVPVDRRWIVTAKHLFERGGQSAKAEDVVVQSDGGRVVACEEIILHSTLDLALVRLSEEIPCPELLWLAGGEPVDRVPSDTRWRAFGYPGESGGRRPCQQVLVDPHPSAGSDRSGGLVRILIAKGIPFGYSGGPVFLELGPRRAFAGIGKLGGDGAAVTEILPAQEILMFLDAQVPGFARRARTVAPAAFLWEGRAGEAAWTRWLPIPVGLVAFLVAWMASGQRPLTSGLFQALWFRASHSVVTGPAIRSENSPVIVAEMSGLAGESRENLGRLVQAIARYRPAGIGLAFDLSPELSPDTGDVALPTPENLRFLDVCQTLRQPDGSSVPSAVGVFRSQLLDPPRWLGMTRHTNLASHLSRPVGLGLQIPAFLQSGAAPPLPGLAMSLAAHYRSRHGMAPRPPWHETMRLTDRWLGSTDRAVRPPVRFESFWVDARPWRMLKETEIVLSPEPDYDAQLQKAEAFWRAKHPGQGLMANRIVLLGGDPRHEPAAPVNLPGQLEPVSGVLYQGCAIWTLLRRPIWSLTVGAECLLLTILLVVYALGRRPSAHFRRQPGIGLLGNLVVGSAALLVAGIGLAAGRIFVADMGCLLFAWAAAVASGYAGRALASPQS